MTSPLTPDFIALQVADLAASRHFYVETIGLNATENSPPGAVVFDTKPVPFAIRTPLVDLNEVKRLGWGVSLWFAHDDVDAFHAQLVEADVPIATPPADGPFGRFFSFSDPDGYMLTVHQARPSALRAAVDKVVEAI